MPALRVILLAALLPLFLVLASCVTMSKEECVAADWRVVGESDGAAGYEPQNRFAEHSKSCQKAGVVPDQTLWYQGYQQGLVRYCTPLSGLSAGQTGKTYYNVCPAGSAEGFLRGYRLGKAEYGMRQEVQSVDSQISSIEYQMREVRKKLDAGQIDERDGRAQLRQYRGDIERLRFEKQRKELELRTIERDAEIFAANPDMILPPRYGY